MSLSKYVRIIIAITVVAVLSLGSVIGVVAFYADLENTAKNNVKAQQKQLLTIASGEIERFFYDVQKRIQTIAEMPVVRNAERSEACNLQLQRMVELNGQELSNLGRVGKDGTFMCAVNRTIIGEPVSKYGDYFQKIASDPQHKPAMSRLIFPAGSATPIVAIHVPVYDAKGAFNGTIGGAIYFDQIQEQLLAGTKLTKNSALVVYDSNADILYNPDPLMQSKSLTLKEVRQLYAPVSALDNLIEQVKHAPVEGELVYSLRNEPRQALYKSAKVTDRYWTVLLAVPDTDVHATMGHQLAKNIFLTTIVIAAVASAAIAYLLLWPHKVNRARR